jgi:hypothetical protein
MSDYLTPAGYANSKKKLASMEARLETLRHREDLHPSRKSATERSYLDAIRQYRREIKLYEAAYPAPH